jgi:hypothetical protein
MPYCSSCGNELRGDTKFCAECGAPAPEPAGGATSAPAAAPPVPPAAAFVSPAPPPPPFPPPPGAPRRSLKWAWISGAAAVVVIAVVCVLVFVVFKGGDDQQASASTTIPGGTTTVTQPVLSTGTTTALPPTTATTAPVSTTAATVASSDDAAAVEAAVMQLFTAMEKQDVELLLNLMDPTILAALPEGDARNAALAAVKAELAALGTMKFSGIKLKVDITSATTAVVTLVAGSVTITDANGKTTTEKVEDSSSDSTMDLVKTNGHWYISSSPFL